MAARPTDSRASGGGILQALRPSRRGFFFGALAAIVLVGMALGLIFLLQSDPTQGPGGSEVSMAKCLACEATFKVDPAKPDADPTPGRHGSPVPLYTCTRCDAERSALLMTRCPNPECEKYFLSSQTLYDHRQYLAARRGKKPRAYDVPPIICPHCDTDYVNFMQARSGRARR